jgi:hypothetical protein
MAAKAQQELELLMSNQFSPKVVEYAIILRGRTLYYLNLVILRLSGYA